MRISKDDLVPDESRSVWSWATSAGESVMFVKPMTIPWGDSLTVNVRLWFPDPPDDPPKRGARTEFLDFETVRVTVVMTTTIRHIDLEGP
jgi:NADPH-dependent ferric siderophore reductase